MDIEKLFDEKELNPTYLKVFVNYPDVLTTGDVCKMLRIDKNKAYQLFKNGEIKSIRLGNTVRVAKVWLLEYLQEKGEHVAETVIQERKKCILAFCKRPRSRVEIQNHLGMCDKTHFRKSLLHPLLAEGKLKMTIPDTPNHIKQKYIAVDK